MTAYLCSVCGAEIEPESVHVFGLKAAMEQRDAPVYELCPKHAENVYWFIRTSRELVKRATDPARDYIPLRGFNLGSDSQSRLTDHKVSHFSGSPNAQNHLSFAPHLLTYTGR